MDFAVTRNATTNAWRVVQRKKAVVSTGYADPLRMTRIRTMTVLMERVTGKTNAKITMGTSVHLRRNVYRIIV